MNQQAAIVCAAGLSLVAAAAISAEPRVREVVVVNNTAQVLEELQLTPQVGAKEVVGRLEAPLSTGASATVRIEGGRCGFVIEGRYEDGSPVTARRDLCKHRRLQVGTLR